MASPRNPYEQFLAELRAARLARQMTQSELAAKIKLSRSHYTAIETGRSGVTYTHMHNLAVALGVRFVIGAGDSPSAASFVAP